MEIFKSSKLFRKGGSTIIKSRTVFLLGYLSSFFCALTLLLLGMSFLYDYLKSDTRNLDTASLLGFISPYTFVLLIMGIALSRFLLRALPPDPLGKIRWKSLLFFIFLASLLFILLTSLIVAVGINELVIIKIVPLLAWSSGVIVLPLMRHLKPRAFLHRPFVLFLRRFSTFSDRSLLNLILNQSSAGKPVVYLTPTNSQPGDWNPFTIGFAGLKLRRPYDSVPIILRASDAQWEPAAEELIKHANIIFIDLSEESGPIQTEITMIGKAGRWSEVIGLVEKGKTLNTSIEREFTTHKSQLIIYEKSWIRSIPRLFIFFFLIPIMLLGPFLVVVSLLNGILSYILGGLGAILGAYIYYTIFMRPSIDKKTKALLRALLKKEINKKR